MSALPAGLRYHSQRERSTLLKWYKTLFVQRSPTYIARGTASQSRQLCTLGKELLLTTLLSSPRLASSCLPPAIPISKLLFSLTCYVVNTAKSQVSQIQVSVPLPCICWALYLSSWFRTEVPNGQKKCFPAKFHFKVKEFLKMLSALIQKRAKFIYQ